MTSILNLVERQQYVRYCHVDCLTLDCQLLTVITLRPSCSIVWQVLNALDESGVHQDDDRSTRMMTAVHEASATTSTPNHVSMNQVHTLVRDDSTPSSLLGHGPYANTLIKSALGSARAEGVSAGEAQKQAHEVESMAGPFTAYLLGRPMAPQ